MLRFFARHKGLFLLLCMALPQFAVAQFTTVTGTVIDPNGLPYANGTITAALVTSTTPTLNGLPYIPPSQPVGLNNSGQFVINLADLTQISPGGGSYSFQVCSSIGTVLPAGGLGPVCFNVTGVGISGSAQDISATLNAAALPLMQSSSGVGSTGYLPADLSAGFVLTPTADPCATILANLIKLIALRPQGVEATAAGFWKFFPAGVVPCNTNPHFKLTFAGRVWWGALQYVSSVPWTTPGANNSRVSWMGSGTADVGNASISPVNTDVRPCTAEAPGWNGSNGCLIQGIFVPAFRGGGQSVTFTFPHPPFQSGTTIFPMVYWGGGTSTGNGTTAGGSFGSMLQDMTIDGGGPGGADVNVYDTGTQENSAFFHFAMRSCNSVCMFFDRVQGTSSGPSHFWINSFEMRMSLNQTASPGYPVVGATPMGYGVWYEGEAVQISASGGGCTTLPQGFVSSINGAGNITGIQLTYGGAGCTSAPACAINEVAGRGGSGATCTWGAPGGGVIPSLTLNLAGTGYSAGDINAEAPFQLANGTINGTPSVSMQEGAVIEGCQNCSVGPLHGENFVSTGSTLRLGAGNGKVQTSALISISNGGANPGLAPIHFGLGTDKNQIALSAVGGTAVVDDQCPPAGTAGSLPGPVSIYDSCSFWVPSGSQSLNVPVLTIPGATSGSAQFSAAATGGLLNLTSGGSTNGMTFNGGTLVLGSNGTVGGAVTLAGSTSGSGTIQCSSATCPALTTAKTFNFTGGLSFSQGPNAAGSSGITSGTGACGTLGTKVGGSWAGAVPCSGTTGASTLLITPGQTAANGWACSGADISTGVAGIQSGSTTTTCTLSFSSVTSGNTVNFTAIPF